MTSSKPPVRGGSDGNDDGQSEPACLLQSTFAEKNRFAEQVVSVDEGAQATEIRTSRPHQHPAVLFEAVSMEGETIARMSALRHRSEKRSRSCKAHLALLRRRTEGLEASRQAPNKELDKLVDKFIAEQSGSEDTCSSQLMEAKHQLNQIHQYVHDLSAEINTTERGILALDKEMEDKLKEMTELEEWKAEELAKCEKQRKEAIAMYNKLSVEMQEMKEIASPSVAMDIHSRTIETIDQGSFLSSKSSQSLVQTVVSAAGVGRHDGHSSRIIQHVYKQNPKQGFEELMSLVNDTESVAQKFLTCMANLKSSSLLETAAFAHRVKARRDAQKNSISLDHEEQEGGEDEESIIGTEDAEEELSSPSSFAQQRMLGTQNDYAVQALQYEGAIEAGAAEWCKDSPPQTCRMLCKAKSCPTGQCLMRSGNCCTSSCKPIEEPPSEEGEEMPEAPIAESVDTTTEPAVVEGEGEELPPGSGLEEAVDTTTAPVVVEDDGTTGVIRDGVGAGASGAEGEGASEEGFQDMKDSEVSCTTDMKVQVTVGGVTTEISPKRNLAAGQYSSWNCEAVEKTHRGLIWLRCRSGSLKADDTNCFPMRQPMDQGTCAEEKDALEKTYVKTYVELARLKAEYGELANSTACFDNVNTQFEIRKAPIQEDIDDLIKAIDKKVKALQGLRPRLQDALDSENGLRKQIKKLSDECAQLPETVSDLDKVRDAIQALSACPGLSRVQFVLPKWTGTWVTFDQDAASMTDEKQDAAMNDACNQAVQGSRAAEVGEIEEQTVEGIPEVNTAETPLMGACPNCDGDAGISYASGHARVCWNAGKKLDHSSKNTACGAGLKAILCVVDRGDIRQIPNTAK